MKKFRAFVIAMECEAESVRPCLHDGDRLYVSGIGKVNAAAATQKAIDDGAAEIFNAGVAGGFGDGISIGDVFEIERAVEYDFDLSLVNGTDVGVHDERKTPYFQFVTTGRFPAKTLGTGDRFRDDTSDFPLLKSLGVEVRDMEGAAIAHVAEKHGVPCRSVKCITNVVGGGAVGQYQSNIGIALERLSAALKEMLAG